jgi:hypothetical protein
MEAKPSSHGEVQRIVEVTSEGQTSLRFTATPEDDDRSGFPVADRLSGRLRSDAERSERGWFRAALR